MILIVFSFPVHLSINLYYYLILSKYQTTYFQPDLKKTAFRYISMCATLPDIYRTQNMQYVGGLVHFFRRNLLLLNLLDWHIIFALRKSFNSLKSHIS